MRRGREHNPSKRRLWYPSSKLKACQLSLVSWDKNSTQALRPLKAPSFVARKQVKAALNSRGTVLSCSVENGSMGLSLVAAQLENKPHQERTAWPLPWIDFRSNSTRAEPALWRPARGCATFPAVSLPNCNLNGQNMTDGTEASTWPTVKSMASGPASLPGRTCQ